MRTSRGWLGIVRRKFLTPFHPEKTIHLHATIIEDAIVRQEITNSEDNNAAASPSISPSLQKKDFSREDIAAIKIQAFFRAHLARRAFRALKSLVKLQALVRGVSVRRQSRIALHCMHALIRLQVRVRARQLLGD